MSATHQAAESAGTETLRRMARATRFNRWMADTLAPFLSGSVLEIGAGIGTLSELLCDACDEYVATDTEAEHLAELQARLHGRKNLRVMACEATDPNAFETLRGCFDTVVCLNVLEHIEDDETALANIFSALRPAGKAVLLVPQGAAGFGSLDELLLHKRRYSRAELEAKLRRAGFVVERIQSFNRITYPGWILNSRILRRRAFSTIQLSLFDRTVPFWRRFDRYLPWPPNSLIGVVVRGS